MAIDEYLAQKRIEYEYAKKNNLPMLMKVTLAAIEKTKKILKLKPEPSQLDLFNENPN